MRNKISGLSIVESLVALAIFSIGILGIMKLNISNFSSLKKSEYVFNQVLLAQNIMEKILNNDYEDIETTCNTENGIKSLSGQNFFVNCSVVRSETDKIRTIIISIGGHNVSKYTISFTIYNS